MNFRKITLLAVTALLVFSLTACGGSASTPAPKTSSPFENMETADLGGNSVTSSVFAENKLTLVNVWNIGCKACVDEMPTLNQLNQDYAEKGAAVMGLYYTRAGKLPEADRELVDEILADNQMIHLIPSEAMMGTELLDQMDLFPTTFFVDSEGNLLQTVYGSRDYGDWSALIDKQLEQLNG